MCIYMYMYWIDCYVIALIICFRVTQEYDHMQRVRDLIAIDVNVFYRIKHFLSLKITFYMFFFSDLYLY